MAKKTPKKPSSNKGKSPNHSIPAFSPFRQQFWREHKWAALLLFILPFVLYGSTATFDYVLDDKIVLTENQFVAKGFAGVSDIFKTESFTGFLGEQQDLVVGARYRPLSIVSFAIEYELWGQNPALSHLINVLLYALCSLLIFRTLYLLVPEKKDAPWFKGVSFAAALLFVLHPVHSEVVANIKGRDEILAVLLSIATLYYCFKYIIEKKPISMVWACACFFFGILAKENTLTFLGVIPLAIALFTKIPRKRFLQTMVPLAAVTILYLIIRVDVIGYLLSSGKEVTALMNNPFVEASGGEKFATITYTMGRYLGLSFVPYPLTHDYYPYHIPLMSWSDWQVILALVLNLGLIGLAIVRWNQSRVLAFSIGFYFLTISITSNILFPVGTFMNERFLFLPSIGFCLAVAYLLLRTLPKLLKDQPSSKMIGLGLTGLMCVGFAFITFARVPAWENNHTLNQAAIKVSVNSARANQYFAYSLYEQYLENRDGEDSLRDPAKQSSLLTEAYPYVNRALEIHPDYSDALTCKGGILGGFYGLNKDVNALLVGFYPLATSENQVSYTTDYLNYINRRRQHPNELIDFYHRVGAVHWWGEKKNVVLARKYLNMGLSIVPDHPQLVADMAPVNAGG